MNTHTHTQRSSFRATPDSADASGAETHSIFRMPPTCFPLPPCPSLATPSPEHRLLSTAEDLPEALVVMPTGYEVVSHQSVHGREWMAYDRPDFRPLQNSHEHLLSKLIFWRALRDVGKGLALPEVAGEDLLEQWSVVGDTFLVGLCARGGLPLRLGVLQR